jgi:hypothetical protein
LSFSAASTCSSRLVCTAGHSATTSASRAYIWCDKSDDGWRRRKAGGGGRRQAGRQMVSHFETRVSNAKHTPHELITTHLLVLLEDLVVRRVARVQLLHAVDVRQDGVQAPAWLLCGCVCECVVRCDVGLLGVTHFFLAGGGEGAAAVSRGT